MRASKEGEVVREGKVRRGSKATRLSDSSAEALSEPFCFVCAGESTESELGRATARRRRDVPMSNLGPTRRLRRRESVVLVGGTHARLTFQLARPNPCSYTTRPSRTACTAPPASTPSSPEPPMPSLHRNAAPSPSPSSPPRSSESLLEETPFRSTYSPAQQSSSAPNEYHRPRRRSRGYPRE